MLDDLKAVFAKANVTQVEAAKALLTYSFNRKTLGVGLDVVELFEQNGYRRTSLIDPDKPALPQNEEDRNAYFKMAAILESVYNNDFIAFEDQRTLKAYINQRPKARVGWLS